MSNKCWKHARLRPAYHAVPCTGCASTLSLKTMTSSRPALTCTAIRTNSPSTDTSRNANLMRSDKKSSLSWLFCVCGRRVGAMIPALLQSKRGEAVGRLCGRRSGNDQIFKIACDFEDDRCWFNRARTPPEISDGVLIAGMTYHKDSTVDERFMTEEVKRRVDDQLASLHQSRSSLTDRLHCTLVRWLLNCLI